MSDAILITGGAGYIGSHCCKLLAAEGYLPVCYDNLSSGSEDFVQFGPLEKGDVRDEARLAQVIAEYRPVAAMHFAARIEVSESVADPAGFFDTNVGGTKALIAACRAGGIANLVFSSTAAVYGAPGVSPIPLDTPTRPENPYGESKLKAEEILEESASESGMGVTCLRYFNAAGAHPDGDIGERHEPETHLIPNLLSAAARGGEAVIYGDDYPTPDGTCVRDYIHVCDLVTAHVAALRSPPKTGEVRRFNLGVGSGYSVREVLASVTRVTGTQVRTRIADRRAGDTAELVAGDTEYARQELGWSPAFPEIDRIISDAWRWQQKLEGGR